LRDWSVSRKTAIRVQRYLEYAFHRHRQRVQEKHVELLALLSEPLRVELTCEVFSRHVAGHPLFKRETGMAHYVSRAVRAASLARADVAFRCGQEASEVVFVATGELDYTLGDLVGGQESDFHMNASHYVAEGEWICEPVLWTAWIHLGDARSTTFTHLILLDAERFTKVIRANRLAWGAARRYAEKFVHKLNQFSQYELTDQTHLLFSPEDLVDPQDFNFGDKRAANADDVFELPVVALTHSFGKKLSSRLSQLGHLDARSSHSSHSSHRRSLGSTRSMTSARSKASVSPAPAAQM
jgi:hypothetical protein